MGTTERNCRVCTPSLNIVVMKTIIRVASLKNGEEIENIFDLGLGFETEYIFFKKVRKGRANKKNS